MSGTKANDSNSEPLMARIHATPEIKMLLAKLWEPRNNDYRRFFFAHRDLLFASVEENGWRITLPFLFVGSAPSETSEHVLVTAGEVRTARQEFNAEIATRKVEEFASEMKAMACFLALRFIVRNPELAKLLESGEPSWAAVAKAVGTARPTFNIFDELNSHSDPVPKGDAHVSSIIRRYTSIIRDFAYKGDFAKYTSVLDFSSVMMLFYGACRDQLPRLLRARQLEEPTYYQIIQELYLQRLVVNTGTTFWCGSCQDDAVIFTSQSRLGPRQLQLPCPKCAKPLSFATVYEPHALIREACLSKDGILGVAVEWLLRKHAVKFETRTFAGDREFDFVLTLGHRRILLECKMHKTDKDDEATENHLTTDLSQAIGHAMEAAKRGEVLDEIWIVTNYELHIIGGQIKRALARHSKNLGDRKLEFVEVSSLPERIMAKR